VLVAIDVDSTLHDYWQQFSAAAMALHGVDLPYAAQQAWRVDALTPQQLSEVVAQTHEDERIAEAVAYDGAAEAIQAWKAAGHEILITTHRRPEAHDATAQWLAEQGIPFDQLRCGWEKVEHCRAVGVGLLIDDSPDNLIRALAVDIAVATIRHPWNADVIAECPEVVHGEDWADLAYTLGETVLRPRQD
jgi:uncharacterized HAD superfamily protein